MSAGELHARRPSELQPYLAEFLGTAILLLVGLSLVIAFFGEGSPLLRAIPSRVLRQSMTGFLFGCVGASLAVSPIGEVSGAHVNPAVTLAFRLLGKIDGRTTVGYVVAQHAGAAVGCIPLLLWGSMGRSVSFGATLPGAGYGTLAVLSGEAVCTFALVTLLIWFLAIHRIRRFTPAMIPVLYAVLVPIEADISGTSTNPARSFGPALISGQWDGFWIYWVGPIAGMLVAALAGSFVAKRITEAKLYHFDTPRDRLFRR